jgi:hypothetical protein
MTAPHSLDNRGLSIPCRRSAKKNLIKRLKKEILESCRQRYSDIHEKKAGTYSPSTCANLVKPAFRERQPTSIRAKADPLNFAELGERFQ